MNPYRAIIKDDVAVPKRSLRERFCRGICSLRKKHTFTSHRFDAPQFFPMQECDWIGSTKTMRYDICKFCKQEVPWGYEPVLIVIFTFPKYKKCTVCKGNVGEYCGEQYHEIQT